MRWLILKLRSWWRREFVWTEAMQLEHLRNLVMTDHRWLAHDKTADALTSRYLAALSEEWFRIPSEDITRLRPRLGLCPHEAARHKNTPEADAFAEERQRWMLLHTKAKNELRAAQYFIISAGVEGADEVLAFTGGSVSDALPVREG